MRRVFLILLMFIVLVSGCIGQADNMVVEKGDHVAVDYWGSLEDGTQFDSSEGRGLLEFDVGAGQMIKGFDDGVLGMKVNETKTVIVAAKDGYGERDSRMIIDVSLNDLQKNNITAKVGMKIYSQGLEGIVTNVTSSTATIDFNHPLAGKTLTFKIKMIKITKGNK